MFRSVTAAGAIILAATAIAAAQTALPAPVAAPVTESHQPAYEPQQLVEKARITVLDATRDAAFGSAPELLRRARAVMIVPDLFKGGFVVGGEGGSAVLLTRNSGVWSDPAFYTLGSASVGFQIGVQNAEVVMLIMSDKALQAMLQNEFKVGAQAGIAVATVGSNAQAATGSNLGAADIIVWAKAQGIYAGLTLEGSVIKPRDSYNAAYYGRPVTPTDIVMRATVRNDAADILRQALTSASS